MQDCIIIDIDGTLADLGHRLHFIKDGNHDWDRFFDAMMNDDATEMMVLLRSMGEGGGLPMFLVSGRPDSHREMTMAWLDLMGYTPTRLFMRKAGDYRADTIVKKEILDQIKAEGFNPILAVDDRPTVIKMWRDNGIPVLEVNVNRWDEGPPRSKAPYLVMMIGPSGGGKTTWAKEAYEPEEIISTDALREYYCGDFKDQSKNNEVFHAYHKLIETRLSLGLLTVADATNIRARDRKKVLALCPKDTTITYVIIDRPMEDKVRDAGWRRGVVLKSGGWLLDAHQQIFDSNLKAILSGDGDEHVTVWDERTIK